MRAGALHIISTLSPTPRRPVPAIFYQRMTTASTNSACTDTDRPVLVSVRNLKKHFNLSSQQRVYAVNGVSFDIHEGETLGLVGESGCGKSTTGRSVLGLYDPTAGQVTFRGQNIHELKGRARRRTLRDMQMIFQDPYASLNPRASVFDLIAEPLDIHGLYRNPREKAQRIGMLLEEVGLNASFARRYPHEFSGGQRQRIGIARALALEPAFIVADEPISALDVSIQAQIVQLLQRLQQERKLTFLFIAHDLSMVQYVSDRVGVMYMGYMAELASSHDLYHNPLHPYTQALLSAIPVPDPEKQRHRSGQILHGELPSPLAPTMGCAFKSRCPRAMPACQNETPVWREHASGHFAACHALDAEGSEP